MAGRPRLAGFRHIGKCCEGNRRERRELVFVSSSVSKVGGLFVDGLVTNRNGCLDELNATRFRGRPVTRCARVASINALSFGSIMGRLCYRP